MNRYKFIVAKPTQPTEKELATAKELTNVSEILAASKSIGEYIFAEDVELCKAFQAANSVALTVETLPNGNDINRAVAILANGAKYRLRVFGSKDLQPAKDFSKEEIKNLKFGFCTSDGSRITENRLNPETGEVVRVPVIYVNIA